MLAVLAAVVIGVGVGFVAQGRPRVLLGLAVAAPLLAVAALAAQFVPGGATECTGTLSGPNTCRAMPAVSGWSLLAFAIALAVVVLSFAPLISLRTGSWIPAGLAAVLQALPIMISWGLSDWAPALLATIAVAFALAVRPRTVGVHGGGAPS